MHGAQRAVLDPLLHFKGVCLQVIRAAVSQFLSRKLLNDLRADVLYNTLLQCAVILSDKQELQCVLSSESLSSCPIARKIHL